MPLWFLKHNFKTPIKFLKIVFFIKKLNEEIIKSWLDFFKEFGEFKESEFLRFVVGFT